MYWAHITAKNIFVGIILMLIKAKINCEVVQGVRLERFELERFEKWEYYMIHTNLDSDLLSKLILFWVIFYITPGPVWVAIMESAKDKGISGVLRLFVKVFLPANIGIQVPQAFLVVLFIDSISTFIAGLEFVFYLCGALYILYMAVNVLQSKVANTSFSLSLGSLVIILLLSPKIWTLFPAGAVIATDLSTDIMANAVIFAGIMFAVSTTLYFFYAFLGIVAYQLLKEKFSYISFVLLVLFAGFLFVEFLTLIE